MSFGFCPVNICDQDGEGKKRVKKLLTYEKDNFYNFFGSRKKARAFSGSFVWIVGPLSELCSDSGFFIGKKGQKVFKSKTREGK